MAKTTVLVELTQNVQNFGHAGEVKQVAFGYARNFLLPRGLVTLVSGKKAIAKLNSFRAHRQEQTQVKQELTDIIKSIEGKSVIINAKSNKDGALYAGIQANDVAKALDIEPNFKIEPIKQVGEYDVVLDFGRDLTAKITIKIESIKNK